MPANKPWCSMTSRARRKCTEYVSQSQPGARRAGAVRAVDPAPRLFFLFRPAKNFDQCQQPFSLADQHLQCLLTVVSGSSVSDMIEADVFAFTYKHARYALPECHYQRITE